MTTELHALYLEVRERAKYRMETFPLAFFQDAATRFGDDAAMTVIRQSEKVLGWAFSLTLGGECHNLYIGLDYANNAESDVYFNLHYFDLKRAFAAGGSRIHLGQTSDEFKSRLGCSVQPLSFYVCAVNPLIHWGLRKFSRLAFPPVEPPKLLNVFRAESNAPVEHAARKSEKVSVDRALWICGLFRPKFLASIPWRGVTFAHNAGPWPPRFIRLLSSTQRYNSPRTFASTRTRSWRAAS